MDNFLLKGRSKYIATSKTHTLTLNVSRSHEGHDERCEFIGFIPGCYGNKSYKS